MSRLNRWRKRGEAVRETADQAPLRLVEKLLSIHGVATHPGEHWIDLPEQEMAISADVVFQSPEVCTFEVRLGLPDERVIVETCAGFGKDRSETATDAFRNFVLGSFHVLLRGVIAGGADEQVDVEEWVIGGVHYHVTLGNATRRGIPDGEDEPLDWFTALREVIVRTNPEHPLSWVRFFVGQLNGQVTVEVLLNNETWEEAEATIRSLPWPMSDGYYSIRHFLTFHREA